MYHYRQKPLFHYHYHLCSQATTLSCAVISYDYGTYLRCSPVYKTACADFSGSEHCDESIVPFLPSGFRFVFQSLPQRFVATALTAKKLSSIQYPSSAASGNHRIIATLFMQKLGMCDLVLTSPIQSTWVHHVQLSGRGQSSNRAAHIAVTPVFRVDYCLSTRLTPTNQSLCWHDCMTGIVFTKHSCVTGSMVGVSSPPGIK
jgi:hypothetical protein